VEKDVILTPEGFEKLQKELETLTTDRRRDVADRIREAREFGDISENSEYDDAKNEQAMLENQIAKLEEQLRAARVIDSSEVSRDTVSLGSQVTVEHEGGKKATYMIVGSAEADPLSVPARISNESPVGKAIIGHKKGETVEVPTPRGSLKYKILEIKAA
jgi:transcription elongation factor GreA